VLDLTCRRCGAQVEVTMPPWAYHLSAIAISLGGQLFAILLLILILMGKWLVVALAIIALKVIDFGRSAWLRRRATVRWINQGSMERRAMGRWTPE